VKEKVQPGTDVFIMERKGRDFVRESDLIA
jgi:hypothetical protein